jgi:TfoX/Sxy family transcriptional regulator of competence genes
MAYDEGIAERVREALVETVGVDEKKMFGGLAFMVSGNMFCGVSGGDLMVRVGPDQYEYALSLPHCREMDFTGRPLKGMVYVSAEGLEPDENLLSWIQMGLEFAQSLPPK